MDRQFYRLKPFQTPNTREASSLSQYIPGVSEKSDLNTVLDALSPKSEKAQKLMDPKISPKALPHPQLTVFNKARSPNPQQR